MKDESKSSPVPEGGDVGQACSCGAELPLRRRLPRAAAFPRECQQGPSMKLLHGQSCLLAHGNLCWGCRHSGLHRGHPQPPRFSLP